MSPGCNTNDIHYGAITLTLWETLAYSPLPADMTLTNAPQAGGAHDGGPAPPPDRLLGGAGGPDLGAPAHPEEDVPVRHHPRLPRPRDTAARGQLYTRPHPGLDVNTPGETIEAYKK